MVRSTCFAELFNLMIPLSRAHCYLNDETLHRLLVARVARFQ